MRENMVEHSRDDLHVLADAQRTIIENLQSENVAMRDALELYAEHRNWPPTTGPKMSPEDMIENFVATGDRGRRARDVLESKGVFPLGAEVILLRKIENATRRLLESMRCDPLHTNEIALLLLSYRQWKEKVGQAHR